MIKIYDLAGRVLYVDKIKSSSEKLHFDAVDGIYFVQIGSIYGITRIKIMLEK